jgi:transposase
MKHQVTPNVAYFAGLDAHQEYVVIAVVDKTGTLVHEGRVRSGDAAQLIAALSPYHSATHPLTVVVETSPFWPWIHDAVESHGIRFQLAHAQELEAIARSARKSDQRDARLLARMLAGDLIPPAYPKSAAQRDTACLLRHRAALVRTRTMLANRIHSQLHAVGLGLPREQLLRKASRLWLVETAWPRLSPEQQHLVQAHWGLLRHFTQMIAALNTRIEARAAADPAACLLATIPGIGSYRSLMLATELLPMTRYASVHKFVGYAGLAPITRRSAGTVHRGPLPAGANRWVRGALVSAIPTHLRLAPQSRLSQYYARQKPRLGWPVARVAAARQLARIMYVMLATGECWREEAIVDGVRA